MDLQMISGGSINVSDAVFCREYNEPLVHQVVVAYLAGGRQGSRAQKTRSEVSGGGKKPWRQKGTGRARAGTNRSPIWRGGGVTFAAKTLDYSQKVNKKMYKAAMQVIFSELIRRKRLLVCENLDCLEPKTKIFASNLRKLEFLAGTIVVEELSKPLILASRNIRSIRVVDYTKANPVNMLSGDKVLTTLGAIRKIEEKLS